MDRLQRALANGGKGGKTEGRGQERKKKIYLSVYGIKEGGKYKGGGTGAKKRKGRRLPILLLFSEAGRGKKKRRGG